MSEKTVFYSDYKFPVVDIDMQDKNPEYLLQSDVYWTYCLLRDEGLIFIKGKD